MKDSELGAEAAVRDDAARDVARLWVAEGERYEMASGELIDALDRLARAQGLGDFDLRDPLPTPASPQPGDLMVWPGGHRIVGADDVTRPDEAP